MALWRVIRRLSGWDVLRLIEVVLWLTLARLTLLAFPFRRVAQYMGTLQSETPATLDAATEARVRHLGSLIRRTADRLPWTCTCLPQALAGKAMLTWRRIPGTVYFGVRNRPEHGFEAHAWLRSGSVYMTGGKGHLEFQVLASFGHQ